MQNEKLHRATKELARKYIELETQLVRFLIEVQRREAYRDFGHKGLFTYCVKHLEFTEAVAQMFRTVVNAAIELPELKGALLGEEGNRRVSVAYASRIVSRLTPENACEVLAYCADHSVRETERWLTKDNSANRTYKIEIDAETYELLQEVRAITAGNPTNAEVIKASLKLTYESRHPLAKAKRATAKAALKTAKNKAADLGPPSVKTQKPPKRQPLSAAVKHKVVLRDENCCTFREPTSERCKNTRWLHRHHVVELSEGGSDDASSILLLCPEHHDLVHQLSFTFEQQAGWFPSGSHENPSH